MASHHDAAPLQREQTITVAHTLRAILCVLRKLEPHASRSSHTLIRPRSVRRLDKPRLVRSPAHLFVEPDNLGVAGRRWVRYNSWCCRLPKVSEALFRVCAVSPTPVDRTCAVCIMRGTVISTTAAFLRKYQRPRQVSTQCIFARLARQWRLRSPGRKLA